MNKTIISSKAPLALKAATAADLMTPEPVSIPMAATLQEATRMLMDRQISACPVVDNEGKAIGVISRSDIVAHDREIVEHAKRVPDFYRQSDLARAAGEDLPKGFQVEQVDRTLVRELMTPAVFAVQPETSAEEVIQQLITLDVHRLFVVDRSGVLVGVISTMDIIRKLLP